MLAGVVGWVTLFAVEFGLLRYFTRKAKHDNMFQHLTAFEQHDLFNILTLLPVSTMNLLSVQNTALRMPLFYSFGAYTIADTAWVLTSPKCVKEPNAIVVHHLLALGLTTVPLLYPEYHMFAILTMTAEINTWFLITKRHVHWKPLRMVLEGLFYSSWVSIRLALYPYLWSRYVLIYLSKIRNGMWFHPVGLSPFLMGTLCVLQFKWSWDLIRKYILRKPKSKDN